MRPLLSLATIALCALLAGCGLTRSRHGAAEITGDWTYATPGATVRAEPFRVEEDQWWRTFGEERLDRLMASVLASNNDLAAAALVARRAHLRARLTAAELGPQIQAGAGATFTETEDESSRSFRASGSIGYELDLWGRAEALRDAADWEARASTEDRQALALSLTGSAASLYWQLGLLNLRVASSEASIANAERTRELVRAQYVAGAVSRLEIEEAGQAVRSQRAAHARLLQSRVETRLAIGLLRDGRIWPNTDEPLALPTVLPPIEAGLPAQLLARRPDLRAAEMRLRRMLASHDANRLSFYPSISLTGSHGGSSASLARVLSDPTSALAAALVLPFLQVNQMRLSTQISEAQYEEARLAFSQTLWRALSEVEATLSARTQLAVQGEELEASLAAAATAERLYEARYRAGAASLRNWLDAQERRRQVELSLEQNRYDQLANLVSLYLSLGGDAER